MFVAGTLLVSGCGSTGVVREMTIPAEQQAENQPVRKLRVHVVFDSREYLEQMKQTLAEASDILKKQVGIELEATISSEPIVWKGRRRSEILDELYLTTVPRTQEFDIAIGFTELSVGETVGCIVGISCWFGVADDTYRRYIVMRTLHPYFLAHELGHLFIFDRAHSDSGLMKAMVLAILPNVALIGSGDYYFAPEDRNEALRNKWRKFGGKVTVADPEDCIGGPCK